MTNQQPDNASFWAIPTQTSNIDRKKITTNSRGKKIDPAKYVCNLHAHALLTKFIMEK